MKKTLLGLGIAAFATSSQAALVYQDDFTSDPNLGSPTSGFDENAGTPGSYDLANTQVDYAHTAGTTRRLINHNNATVSFASTQGYMKAEISNYVAGPSIWIGFVEDNATNNQNYARELVSGNGTYELVVNNSSSSISFNNGAGWSGTLAANSGLLTLNGGTSTTALSFGTGVTSDVAFKGFGFANFGNSAVFPSSSFSIDSIAVYDTAVIPEPSVFGLTGLGLLTFAFGRRRRR
ncbi:PEP-CTERM sorting domain-containing protein [Haloferula sp.]|uniref:PEP-CTERM sorting domain-containing protein n=1 Tax=Haloferula sp. TaxID=2497595 RepID=UPI00329DBBE7